MKRLVSLALALLLSLNLLGVAHTALAALEDDPPIPVVTAVPVEPGKPSQPPVEPQDDRPPECETVRDG